MLLLLNKGFTSIQFKNLGGDVYLISAIKK